MAFEALVNRLDSGAWEGLDPTDLNNAANALGTEYNDYPPSYFTFQPDPFLRPFDWVNH